LSDLAKEKNGYKFLGNTKALFGSPKNCENENEMQTSGF
jgi:hypothetical protein